MNKSFALLPAVALVAALAVGCQKDKGTMQDGSSSSGTSMQKPLEGNPGATTNQAVGYPQSDPGAYHPQTDDTRQYHPAPPSTVQPAAH